MPGHSPLPTPGERPADRRALRLGAVFAMLTLAVALVPGQFFLPQLLYLTPGLLSQAGTNSASEGGPAFQGFAFVWTQLSTGNGGYTSPASLANMRSEAHDFHMNTVVISVVADMPYHSESTLYWHSTDHYNHLDTLPDAAYRQAIEDARRAGLEPVLELEVRQQDIISYPFSEDPYYVGDDWHDEAASQNIVVGLGQTATVGSQELGWVDNYTAFSVHYAALAQAERVNYLIVGDSLGDMSSDGPASTQKSDPRGTAAAKAIGDNFTCGGRHECEWRHIIGAVRNQAYSTYLTRKQQTGASYAGKLIYAARWGPGHAALGSGAAEYETIQWWDAVDAIGVDAYFPLTQNFSDPPLDLLEGAWHGRGTALAGSGDIFSRLLNVHNRFGKQILFTAAGYESTPGSNIKPGDTSPTVYDQNEQLTDMQALLLTFAGTSWWAGVIWWADAPLPRSAQRIPSLQEAAGPNWTTGTQWAGNNLSGTQATDAKAAGRWLATYYHSVPVPCLC
jgi:hypothetical protein